MFTLEIFTEAIATKDLKRANEIASIMTVEIKSVAREIWCRWIDVDCPF